MKSYSKVARKKIQDHILSFYNEERDGIIGIIEDMNNAKHGDMSDRRVAEYLVVSGCFLISHFDQRNFIDSLNINDGKKEYSNDEVFKKYVNLLAREIIAMTTIHNRLEEIRKSVQAENISYSEIVELQSLADYISADDIELLQWAKDEK